MRGFVKKIPTFPESGKFRFYCFVEGEGSSYFLHSSDFDGHWFNDLCNPSAKGEQVELEFEPVQVERADGAKWRAIKAKLVGRKDE